MGVASFSTRYTLPAPWFDGVWLGHMPPIEVEDTSGVILLEAHSGVSILQKIYRRTDAPEVYGRKIFRLQMQADDEASWYAFKLAKAKGGVFWWCCGLRMTDVFTATSGQSYKLTRPLAKGIVPGVTETLSPTIVYLDGVVDAGAATVSGQVVSALKTGQIHVEYTPVHRVVMPLQPESLARHNDLQGEIVLEEVIA